MYHLNTNLNRQTCFCVHIYSYIGSKKSETAPESRPAAAAWSGSFLSGSKRRAAGRPEPLWRPAYEEEEKVQGPSSEESKPSVSKPAQGHTSPPSPRTLEAIQAAMNDSSDEEKLDKKGGSVSPRTLLAIHQALAEEEDGAAEHGTLISSSPTKLQANIHHPVPQVVISSSEEEPEPANVNSLPSEKTDLQGNPKGHSQSLQVRDSLLISSSEDEMEEVIGQRNKALHLAVLHQPQERETMSEEETKKGQLTEELERKESEHRFITDNRDLVQPPAAAASPQNLSSINLSAQICGKPPSVETEIHTVQGSNKSIEAPEERREDDVKSEGSEESESEGTVIVCLRSHVHHFLNQQIFKKGFLCLLSQRASSRCQKKNVKRRMKIIHL